MGGHIKQKLSSFRASFDFGEDELTYSFDNSRTRAGASVPYHKIPGRTGYREIKIWWLRYMLLSIVTFLAVITLLYYMGDNDMAMALNVGYFSALLFLCTCLIALLQGRRGMTSIALDPALYPALYVLHDGRQDTILADIMQRRLEAIRKKMAQVDFNKPYFEEARKFRWLKEEEIISEQEYRSARQKIAAMRDKGGLPPPEPGKVN